MIEGSNKGDIVRPTARADGTYPIEEIAQMPTNACFLANVGRELRRSYESPELWGSKYTEMLTDVNSKLAAHTPGDVNTLRVVQLDANRPEFTTAPAGSPQRELQNTTTLSLTDPRIINAVVDQGASPYTLGNTYPMLVNLRNATKPQVRHVKQQPFPTSAVLYSTLLNPGLNIIGVDQVYWEQVV